jgi:hypothetical protein
MAKNGIIACYPSYDSKTHVVFKSIVLSHERVMSSVRAYLLHKLTERMEELLFSARPNGGSGIKNLRACKGIDSI